MNNIRRKDKPTDAQAWTHGRTDGKTDLQTDGNNSHISSTISNFGSTVKPRYSAPAYNEFPPIQHTYFGPKEHFHSYFYVGNSENLGIKHNSYQSLEMRCSRVKLYLLFCHFDVQYLGYKYHSNRFG